MKYAKGVCWVDDTRIPFVDDKDTFMINKLEYQGKDWYKEGCEYKGIKEQNTQGRFTPNLLVCDDLLNDGVITSQSSGLRKNPGIKTQEWKAGHKKKDIMTTGDKGTNSRYYDLDIWFDKIIEGL